MRFWKNAEGLGTKSFQIESFRRNSFPTERKKVSIFKAFKPDLKILTFYIPATRAKPALHEWV